MQRSDLAECDPGDWIPMMEAPAEWGSWESPVSWEHPDGSTWSFAFTAVPAFDEDTGDTVGTNFVWMRFETGTTPPPAPSGPTAFGVREPGDPADWWKSK